MELTFRVVCRTVFGATEGLPLVMIRIPGVGQVSRKERDELKAQGQEKGLRVFDDMKRLDRDFPEKMAAVRERISAQDDDLLLIASGRGVLEQALDVSQIEAGKITLSAKPIDLRQIAKDIGLTAEELVGHK